MTANETNGASVRTLAKGLAVLDVLVRDGIVRTGEVAERLGLDKGGTSRLLQTLVAAGYAVRIDGRGYRAGPRLSALRGNRTDGVRARARPVLEALAAEFGECAYLGIPADDRVLYLDKIDIENPLKVDHPVGTLAPLERTALGKVLLAYGCVGLPATGGPADPAASMTLDRELSQIVATGWAVDDEGRAPGVRCVAAPFRDDDGIVVAAVAIAGPSSRIRREDLDDLGRRIAETITVARPKPPTA